MVTELRLVWNTPGGGTGYSVFHIQDPFSQNGAQFAADALHQWAAELADLVPNECTLQEDVELRVLNPASGSLVDTFTIVQGPVIPCTQAATYNRAAGARIDWSTGAVVGGRRLRGRTYIVPLGANAFGPAGLLDPGVALIMGPANDAFLAALENNDTPLQVWSRTYGQTRPVTGYSFPPDGAILRGRRD